jgi:hypothetical protein
MIGHGWLTAISSAWSARRMSLTLVFVAVSLPSDVTNVSQIIEPLLFVRV